MLNDRLLQFVDIDLHDVKVCLLSIVSYSCALLRLQATLTIHYILTVLHILFQDAHKRFDKASLLYDQVSL